MFYSKIFKLNNIVSFSAPTAVRFLRNAKIISRGFCRFFGHNFDPHLIQ